MIEKQQAFARVFRKHDNQRGQIHAGPEQAQAGLA
jgi:hypothetical protein